MTERIILTRGHGFDMGTPGELILNGFTCYTMERPWEGNQRSVSCIPPGVYRLRQRPSEVVHRASNGRYSRGWEVKDVPGRTFIMIHPGNSIDDTEGCILPGEGLSCWSQRWTVTNSQATFRKLMEALSERSEWTIDIRYFMPEYP